MTVPAYFAFPLHRFKPRSYKLNIRMSVRTKCYRSWRKGWTFIVRKFINRKFALVSTSLQVACDLRGWTNGVMGRITPYSRSALVPIIPLLRFPLVSSPLASRLFRAPTKPWESLWRRQHWRSDLKLGMHHHWNMRLTQREGTSSLRFRQLWPPWKWWM